MIKVKVLMPTVINGKVCYEGDTVDIEKAEAIALIKRGRIIPVGIKEEKAVKSPPEKAVKINKKDVKK